MPRARALEKAASPTDPSTTRQACSMLAARNSSEADLLNAARGSPRGSNDDSDESDSSDEYLFNSDLKNKGIAEMTMGFGRQLIPTFLYSQQRTVYGGNPVGQQTLPGYFAYPTPFIMIPIFFILMVPFIVVGASIVVKNGHFYSVAVSYSDVHAYQYIPNDQAVDVTARLRHFAVNGSVSHQGVLTTVPFKIAKRMKAPVHLYYTIDNMHQNYRYFNMGRSTKQLRGKAKIGNVRSCHPYSYPGYDGVAGPGAGEVMVHYTTDTGPVARPASSFIYNPCGVAAWAMFNDTFVLYQIGAGPENHSMTEAGLSSSSAKRTAGAQTAGKAAAGRTLICNGTDFDPAGRPLNQSISTNWCQKQHISWPADQQIRFKPLTPAEQWWSQRFPYKTDNDYLNHGWYLNEPGHAVPEPADLDLQVWMRSALLSNFRKLYRSLDIDLLPGEYEMEIEEYYDTVTFFGKKGFLLRTKSWVGDGNVPLGVLYMVIGGLAFVLGVVFSIELILSQRDIDRCQLLPLPKRNWYYFDPNSREFAQYFALREERYLLAAELRTLQEIQALDKQLDSSRD